MQQTTCGETPKVRVYDRENVDNFLKSSSALFSNLKNSKNCMYEEGKIVSDQSLNFLNVSARNNCDNQLKILIKKEFIECEGIYPYLGDFFISQYFESNKIKFDEKILVTRDNYLDISKRLAFETNTEILNCLFENGSLEYSVTVEKSVLKDVHIEKIDTLNFNLEYDSSFLGNSNNHSMDNYKFIIIDGHVESVGEIHHILDQAYNTKIPHVIFCFGMSSDVEHVIKYNNTHSKFEVFPVIIKFDENTINILNDIAVLHNSTIVSSRSGQTISQAAREELPTGDRIVFHRTGFKIRPIASENQIKTHRHFLINRINESNHEEGKKLLSERLKRFSSKTIKIFIPDHLYDNNDFIRELNYLLSILKNVSFVFARFDLGGRDYLVPIRYLNYVDKKVESLKKVYKNIDRLIINAGI